MICLLSVKNFKKQNNQLRTSDMRKISAAQDRRIN